jgi:hypothetical protein
MCLTFHVPTPRKSSGKIFILFLFVCFFFGYFFPLIFAKMLLFISLLVLCLADQNPKVDLTVDYPKQTCYAPGAQLDFIVTVVNDQNGASDNKVVATEYVWNSTPITVRNPTCPATGSVDHKATYSCTNTILFPTDEQLDLEVGVRGTREGNGIGNHFNYEQVSKLTYFSKPTITTSSSPATCNGGSDGSFTFTLHASALSGPYIYAINGGATASVVPGTPVTISSKAAAVYTITVTSTKSSYPECAVTATVTITQPIAVMFHTAAKDPTCHDGDDGSIQVIATGGTGDYEFSKNGVWSPASISPYSFLTLSSGTYTLAVRDSLGCAAPQQTVTLTNPDAFVFTSSSTQTTCNGASDGTITVQVTGNGVGPYTYSLNDGGPSPVASQGPTSLSVTFTGLKAGTYTINTADSNTPICKGRTIQIVSEPAVVTFTTSSTVPTCNVAQTANTDGTITVSASGGSGTYKFSINGVPTAATASPYTFIGLSSATLYQITVTDSNDCATTTATASITLATPVCLQMCSRSQGYWGTHRSWISTCPTTATSVCESWCGHTFQYYLDTTPRGNALIIAGKQFVAFVLNFYYYNQNQNIRTGIFPSGFPLTIQDAFIELKTGCSLPKATLLADAAILEQFNIHNTTLYSWVSECSASVRDKPLIKQFKK